MMRNPWLPRLKSRMHIAPIAKTSEASDSTCTQSIPAMAASVG
jgi:hypothetical protein